MRHINVLLQQFLITDHCILLPLLLILFVKLISVVDNFAFTFPPAYSTIDVIEREGDTIVYNLVVSPTSEVDQIHLNPAANRLTPTFHFDRQSASSILTPTFTLSSSTCFFHVLFSLPFFLCHSTSKSNALLMT